MSLGASASYPKPPCLFSLDETVIISDNDDDPPCLDACDVYVDVRQMLFSLLILVSSCLF